MKQHWTKQQIKSFVLDVRKFWGSMWVHVSLDVRRALVAERALAVIRQQHADSVSMEAMDELTNRMMVEAGVEDSE